MLGLPCPPAEDGDEEIERALGVCSLRLVRLLLVLNHILLFPKLWMGSLQSLSAQSAEDKLCPAARSAAKKQIVLKLIGFGILADGPRAACSALLIDISGFRWRALARLATLLL